MKRYGCYTLDDIKGRYYLKCSISGSPCSLCRGPIESPTCAHGLLSVSGLSGPDAKKLLITAIHEDSIENLRQYYENSGETPWGSSSRMIVEENGAVREPVDDDMFNPFKNFPNDISYNLSEVEIDSRRKMYTVEKRMRIGSRAPLPAYAEWTDDRVEAALGKQGKLAQRCAAQDLSWGVYLDTNKKASEKEMAERLRVIYLRSLFARATNDEDRKRIMDKLKG